jgi:hypothetical protein
MAEENAPINEGKLPKDALLNSLRTKDQALMLRKVIRTLHSKQPNKVLSALINVMGDDPAPLPKTPTFQNVSNYNTRGRGRGRGRARGGRVHNIRSSRYDNNNQNAWRNRTANEQNTKPNPPGFNNKNKISIEQKPARESNYGKSERNEAPKNIIRNTPHFEPPAEDSQIPPRESMQDFFKDIETLPDAERNRMIQVCIKELIEENKLLRDANRRLVQKQRVYPQEFAPSEKKEEGPRLHPADVRQKSKNLNVHAAEFEMSEPSAAAMAPLPHELYENQHGSGVNDSETLRYEDFVRMRREERDRHEFEEMVAEQMYLEEMEMYAQGGSNDYGPPGAAEYDPRFTDPRFFDEMAYGGRSNYY